MIRRLQLTLVLCALGLPAVAQVSSPECRAVSAALGSGALPEATMADTTAVEAMIAADDVAACTTLADEAGLTIVDMSGPSACAALNSVASYGLVPADAAGADDVAGLVTAGDDTACGTALEAMGYGAGVEIPDCAALVQRVGAGDLPAEAMGEAAQLLQRGLLGDDPAECTEALGEIEAAEEAAAE